MKNRAKIERELGKQLLDALSFAIGAQGGLWYARMGEATESEPCRCVGPVMFVDARGVPEGGIGFVLESLDGNRLYTAPHVRIERPGPTQ